jgi:hypothetical protein
MEDNTKNLDDEIKEENNEQEKPRIKEIFISDKERTPKQVRGFEDIKWCSLKQSRFQGFLKKIFRSKEQKYF